MSTHFTEQNIIDDGVDDFHMGHHIIYFDGSNLPHVHFSSNMIFPLAPSWHATVGKTTHVTKDIDPIDVTGHLMEIFEYVFNPNSTATAGKGTIGHNGAPTVCFTGNLFSVPLPHDDWVYMKEHLVHPHLYGTTLRRNFSDIDDLLVEVIPTAVTILSPLAGLKGSVVGTAVDIATPNDNNKHFLSGRRVWRCGFSEEHQCHFFETAAFERFSDPAYALMEPMVRPMLDQCWMETVINFSLLIGAPIVDIGTMPGYTKQRNFAPPQAGTVFSGPVPSYGPVYFKNDSFSASSKADARSKYTTTSWFNNVIQALPSLSVNEMPGMQ